MQKSSNASQYRIDTASGTKVQAAALLITNLYLIGNNNILPIVIIKLIKI